MARKVSIFSEHQDPAVCSSPAGGRRSKSKAAQLVARGDYRWVHDFAIQRIAGAVAVVVAAAVSRQVHIGAPFYDGPFGVGNLLPFARIPSRLLKPEPLHYQIPAIGARSRPMRVSEINAVGEAES
jgi:hypothetical protein